MDFNQPNSQEQDPIQQIEVLDADEVPPQYRNVKYLSSGGRRGNRQGGNKTGRRNTAKDQPKLPSHETTRRFSSDGAHHSAPANNCQSIIKILANLFLPSNHKRSVENFEQHEQENYKQNDPEHPTEESHRWDGMSEQMLISENNIIELRQEFQDTIESKEREWKARERELQHHISQISHPLEEDIRMLQAKLHKSESEKHLMQEQHNSIIRKYQEASFRQMKSARWLPVDEGKVMIDLDLLKRDMRSWAKATSIENISLLLSIREVDSVALMQDLANVALVENGQLPEGLSTAARCPMLLLNALLAHSVFTSFFQSPFFFLGNNNANVSFIERPECVLDDVYKRAQEANQQDAYIWRSQTLRLIMPPLRDDESDAETQLRRTTEDSIAQAADLKASEFLASPASFLINNKANADIIKRLRKIYNDAASLSSKLWTRRTEMRCFTLYELKHVTFDAESEYFDPDNLVRYDDHEDHLKGKKITVMVHPLLIACGNDEAKDYDQERVWSKGVVWLNSKKD